MYEQNKFSIFRAINPKDLSPRNTASRKRTVFTLRNFSGHTHRVCPEQHFALPKRLVSSARTISWAITPPVGRARGWIPRFLSCLSINGLFRRMFYRIHFAHWNICYNKHFSKNTRIDCWAITLLSKRRPPFFNGLDEAPEGDASSTLLIIKKT